jgi:5'-nucleotidase
MPHIVITNDDGIYAEGLRTLVDALQGAGTVSVVAPSQERSAAAQSLTLRQPIFCERVAEREWSVEGTPTDAMMVALHQLFAQPPDLVISGINRGGNMGENVFYSGTVGAAMEAAINQVPAFAISLVHRGAGLVYADAAAFARRLAETILAEGLPEGLLLNVNVPPVWNGSVRFTHQSKKVTRNVLEKGVDAQGRTFYWLGDQKVIDEPDAESDIAAVLDGAVSVTPLEIDRTHGASLPHLSQWAKRLARPQGTR